MEAAASEPSLTDFCVLKLKLYLRPIVERFNIVLYLCDTYTICLVYKIKESDATSTILAVPYRWNHLLPLPHRGVSLRHIYYT